MKNYFKYDYGGVSTEGYKRDSPDRFNAFNIIPSNIITMRNVRHPVLGIDNTGVSQLMYPGFNYAYPGASVLELPLRRMDFAGEYDPYYPLPTFPIQSVYDRLKPNPFPGLTPRPLPVGIRASLAEQMKRLYNGFDPMGVTTALSTNGQAVDKGRTYNLPGLKKTTRGANVPLAGGVVAGLSFLGNALEAKDRNKYREWDRLMGMADNLGIEAPGSRGDYTLNEGFFRPDQYTPVQFGAVPMAQAGGFFSDPMSAPMLETPQELYAYSGAGDAAINTNVVDNVNVGTEGNVEGDVPNAVKPNKKVQPNDAARDAFNYYVNEKSLAPHVAAGIVGNLYQESGVKANINQQGGGPGRGVAQWTIGSKGKKDRWDHFLAWSKKKELDPYNLYAQLDYILEEPGEGAKAMKALMKTTTPEEASYAFGKTYERPAEKYAAWDVRAGIARKLYDEKPVTPQAPEPEVKADGKMNGFFGNWFREGGEYAKKMPGDKPDMRSMLSPVERSMANIEAERGETVWGDFDRDGIDEHLQVGGKPHSSGGTPLAVPDGAFVFSNTKRLKIGGPVLQEFGKSATTKKKYTPAELAKQYNVNKYKALLKRDNLDKIERDSAELMMDNYQRKLGMLALLQEGMKGFPQGIPGIAAPLLEEMGLNSEMPTEAPMQEQYVAQNDGAFTDEGLPMEGPIGMPTGMPMGLPKAQDGAVLRRAYPQPGVSTILHATPGMKIIRRTAPLPFDPPYDPNNPPEQISIPMPTTTPGATIPIYGGDVTDPRAFQRGTLKLGKGFNKYNAPWLEDYGYDNSAEGLTKAIMASGYKGDINDVKGVQQFLIQKNLDKGNLGLFDDLLKSYGMTNKGIKSGLGEGINTFEDLEKMKDDPKLQETLEKAFADGWFGARSGDMVKTLLKREMIPARLNVPKIDLSTGTPNLTNIKVPQFPKVPVAEKKEEPLEYKGPEKQKMPVWLQDAINALALTGDRYNLHKYDPTMVKSRAALANGVFYDPTRALAVGQEAAASQNLMNTLLSGAQRFRGVGSQIQGQLAGHVANTAGDYNNRNVSQATALEAAKAQVLSGLAAQNAAAYDAFLQRGAIANQQFDNSKRLANNDMRLGLVNAITNAQKTYWLNRLNPQYNIDPSSGRLFFRRGKGIRDNISGSVGGMDTLAAIKQNLDRFNAVFPGADPARAYAFAEKMAFGNRGGGDDDMAQQLALLQGYGRG